ncbi:hypothetical protein FQZ97_1005310 [compost metagenome]
MYLSPDRSMKRAWSRSVEDGGSMVTKPTSVRSRSGILCSAMAASASRRTSSGKGPGSSNSVRSAFSASASRLVCSWTLGVR